MRGHKCLLFGLMICLFTMLPAIVLGAEEILRIRVGTAADFPPFESVDPATGEIVGFDIDLMNAIAEEAGFRVEYLNKDFNRIFPGLENNEYDAIISALTITDERKQHYDFSDPYVTVTVPDSKYSPDNLEDYGIAVKKGNKKVLDIINSGLKKVMEDGLVDQLKKKWKID